MHGTAPGGAGYGKRRQKGREGREGWHHTSALGVPEYLACGSTRARRSDVGRRPAESPVTPLAESQPLSGRPMMCDRAWLSRARGRGAQRAHRSRRAATFPPRGEERVARSVRARRRPSHPCRRPPSAWAVRSLGQARARPARRRAPAPPPVRRQWATTLPACPPPERQRVGREMCARAPAAAACAARCAAARAALRRCRELG